MDVAEALTMIHADRLAHSEITSSHILIDRNGHAMLTSFGWSRPLPAGEETVKVVDMETKGYVRVLSPEQLTDGTSSTSSDVWQFGTLMWELFSASPPYTGLTNEAVRSKILSGDISLPIDPTWPPVVQTLIARCRVTAAAKRPAMSVVMQSIKTAVREMEYNLAVNQREIDALKPKQQPASPTTPATPAQPQSPQQPSQPQPRSVADLMGQAMGYAITAGQQLGQSSQPQPYYVPQQQPQPQPQPQPVLQAGHA